MDEPLPVVNSKSQGVDEPDDDMEEEEKSQQKTEVENSVCFYCFTACSMHHKCYSTYSEVLRQLFITILNSDLTSTVHQHTYVYKYLT